MEAAFEKIFREIYPNLLFYAMRLVGELDSEDVVQDVFIEFWSKNYDFRDYESIRALLYRSVYNKALNVIKHRGVVSRNGELLKEISLERLSYYNPEHSEVMARIENLELRKTILSAIDALPEKCRNVFVMSYLYDMSNKMSASLMNISVKTVEAHMYKALKNLRAALGPIVLTFFIFILK